MTFINKLKTEFSFIKGNYTILVTSWILIDFATELPATYYALYILKPGATETILSMTELFSLLTLASIQFPEGYLAQTNSAENGSSPPWLSE